MKIPIIEITDFEKGIPKYKTWYKYYDDLFVSVIYSNNSKKSHLRIKNTDKNVKAKTDNKMCFWHSDWQYTKIENAYGIAKTGKKTYEISEIYNGEVHRIDSVVEKIAIEFQHSLNVSLNEMESRYIAHNALGYIPYLMLDFTKYSSKETFYKYSYFNPNHLEKYINNCDENSDQSIFLKSLKKWISSEYYKAGNLFINFSDSIIRFVPKIKKQKIEYSESTFLEELKELEGHISEEIFREKEEEELKKREKEEKELERLSQLKLSYKAEIENNKHEIIYSPTFKYYRKCLQHRKIKERIDKQSYIEMIKYNSFNTHAGNIYRKFHVYSIFESAFSAPVFEIQYITISRKENKEFKYVSAEILLIEKFDQGIIVLELLSESNGKLRMISKKLELVRGYLHSTTHPAKFEFDVDEKLISKEYYLFNNKVTEQEFNDLSDYVNYGHFLDNNDKIKYKDLLEKLYSNDDYGLIKGFCQNYIDHYHIEKYYEENELIQPLIVKNEW